jgi:hypothetical protein
MSFMQFSPSVTRELCGGSTVDLPRRFCEQELVKEGWRGGEEEGWRISKLSF